MAIEPPGHVLDSSAVLCLIAGERGHERVASALTDAAISSVNLAEVASKLSDRGLSDDAVARMLDRLDLRVIAFDAVMARRAGLLRASTKRRGLSLGDRACLATAEAVGAAALTADRAWFDLDVGIAIEAVR